MTKHIPSRNPRGQPIETTPAIVVTRIVRMEKMAYSVTMTFCVEIIIVTEAMPSVVPAAMYAPLCICFTVSIHAQAADV